MNDPHATYTCEQVVAGQIKHAPTSTVFICNFGMLLPLLCVSLGAVLSVMWIARIVQQWFPTDTRSRY